MLCVYSDRYRYKLKNDKVALYYVPHQRWSYEEDTSAKDNSFVVVSKKKVKTPMVRLIAFAVVIAMVILVLSPIITFYTDRITTNLKRMLKTSIEKKAAKKAANKAAATAAVETSDILDDVTYEEDD